MDLPRCAGRGWLRAARRAGHTQRHDHPATIAERNARALYAALTPLRAATCDELHSVASRTGEEIVAEGRARNRAYDVQTKHGQTQGVELGP